MTQTTTEPTQPLQEKTFKLPIEVREYHRKKTRETRNWKCTRCGNPNPIVKLLDEKDKLCYGCNIEYLKANLDKRRGTPK